MGYFRCLIHLQRWKSFKSAGKTGTLKDRASDEGQASRTVDDALKVVLEEMRVRSRILARPLRPRRRGQPNFQGQRSPPRRLQGSPEPLFVLRHEFQHDSQAGSPPRWRAQGIRCQRCHHPLHAIAERVKYKRGQLVPKLAERVHGYKGPRSASKMERWGRGFGPPALLLS